MTPNGFFSCDWGTTHFRLRLVERDSNRILAEIKSPQGAGTLARDNPGSSAKQFFPDTLFGHIRDLLTRHPACVEHCFVSGMATSNLGWLELPYAPTPLRLASESLITSDIAGSGDLIITLISGVRTDNDVMRGEETELLGLVRLVPGLSACPRACVILPGTHSKHAHLRRGVLTDFTTHMTGEFFSHLSRLPTLAGGFPGTKHDFEEDAFQEGVNLALKEGLGSALFKVRSRHVLDHPHAFGAGSFLSGILIGSECKTLIEPSDEMIYLGGGSVIQNCYRLAAEACGLTIHLLPPALADTASLHGHAAFLTARTEPEPAPA